MFETKISPKTIESRAYRESKDTSNEVKPKPPKTHTKPEVKIQISENCQDCYYYKLRDVDESGQLAWGPWCLEFGQPVRCLDVTECETEKINMKKRAKSMQLGLDI